MPATTGPIRWCSRPTCWRSSSSPAIRQGITGVADLANDDLIMVVCAPEVPCGNYAQQIFDAAGVTVTPDSLEENVKAVVTKVTAGEADAGIVYKTDVTAAGDEAEGVEIPADINVLAEYPIAVTKEAPEPGGGASLHRLRPQRAGPEDPRLLRLPAAGLSRIVIVDSAVATQPRRRPASARAGERIRVRGRPRTSSASPAGSGPRPRVVAGEVLQLAAPEPVAERLVDEPGVDRRVGDDRPAR